MNLEIQHVEIRVSSLEEAKEFYVNKLELTIIEEIPALHLIALKAGNIRISIFGGFEKKSKQKVGKYSGTHLIFRTKNLDKTIAKLTSKGIKFIGEIVVAGDFMKDLATTDPDGNLIEFAEYLKEPIP